MQYTLSLAGSNGGPFGACSAASSGGAADRANLQGPKPVATERWGEAEAGVDRRGRGCTSAPQHIGLEDHEKP